MCCYRAFRRAIASFSEQHNNSTCCSAPHNAIVEQPPGAIVLLEAQQHCVLLWPQLATLWSSSKCVPKPEAIGSGGPCGTVAPLSCSTRMFSFKPESAPGAVFERVEEMERRGRWEGE
ncbi:unnamed protein product [Heligmosomoides polygyrus]|uniref:Uncharacterized protein n=1 Tax=Heligmosomoides polygyrus TaxID=6339 RepID=A0A183GHS2_HELPZ|nr:unnamed protein product [Heligmosomoides polygyrus]